MGFRIRLLLTFPSVLDTHGILNRQIKMQPSVFLDRHFIKLLNNSVTRIIKEKYGNT